MFNRLSSYSSKLLLNKNIKNFKIPTTPQPIRFFGTNHNNNNNSASSGGKNNNNNNNNNNGSSEIEFCKVICTSKGYSKSIENLPKGFTLQKVFDTSNTRWLVEQDSGESVYVFPSFGCIVSWGLKEQSLKSIIDWVKPYELKPHETKHVDNYKYKITTSPTSSFEINKRPEEFLKFSKFEKDQDIEKFSSSYAFAQSVSLFPLEDRVQQLSDFVEDGKINQLTKLEIIRQMGEQLKLKSNLNLHSDIVDTPEHFWENPEGENIYNAVRNHCEINKRIRVMNEKLNLITDIYEVINSEQKHNHSIRLERIIIFLIAMEIFITLLRELRDHIQDKKSNH